MNPVTVLSSLLLFNYYSSEIEISELYSPELIKVLVICGKISRQRERILQCAHRFL